MSEPFPFTGDPERPITEAYSTQVLKAGDLSVSEIIHHVLRKEGVSIGEITVVFADHEEVLNLNKRFLDHDYHTDVLAFPYSGASEPISGEIYIDVETARERHREFDATLTEEVARYLIHGLLHLCGYTDKKAAHKSKMQEKETSYLRETRTAWMQEKA